MGNKLEPLSPLPPRFQSLGVLGQGTFGVVHKCLDKDTKETVAVKISKDSRDLAKEAELLQLLMDNKADQKNIVKCYNQIQKETSCLVFELLDISLSKFLQRTRAPMCLRDIRTVMQQMATALDGLKTLRVIHTDLTPSNIMLVDHKEQPFQVKLIDFGLALFTHMAKDHRLGQVTFYRAPEVILGLPYSEAVDIWSLGCVMAEMLLGRKLFPATNNYDLLTHMVEILGLPPDRVVRNASYGTVFFKETALNHWILKPPWIDSDYMDSIPSSCRTLGRMKKMRLEFDNHREAEQRGQCIDLLRAMLTWDERERITPMGILNHPFITQSYLSETSDPDPGHPKITMVEPVRVNPDDSTGETWGPSDQQRNAPDSAQPSTSGLVQLTRGVIFVQPAPPQNQTGPDQDTAREESITLADFAWSFTDEVSVHAGVEICLQQIGISMDSTSEDKTRDGHDPTAFTAEDPKPDSPASRPSHTDDSESRQTTRRRKKRRFKCLLSWLERTLCCCCSVHNVDD